MKKQKNTVTETVVATVSVETKKMGRPVNTESKRQQRIAELEAQAH